jgi:hypothetical protein
LVETKVENEVLNNTDMPIPFIKFLVMLCVQLSGPHS